MAETSSSTADAIETSAVWGSDGSVLSALDLSDGTVLLIAAGGLGAVLCGCCFVVFCAATKWKRIGKEALRPLPKEEGDGVTDTVDPEHIAIEMAELVVAPNPGPGAVVGAVPSDSVATDHSEKTVSSADAEYESIVRSVNATHCVFGRSAGGGDGADSDDDLYSEHNEDGRAPAVFTPERTPSDSSIANARCSIFTVRSIEEMHALDEEGDAMEGQETIAVDPALYNHYDHYAE